MINILKVMILEDQETDQILVKRQVLKFNPKSVFLVAKDKSSFLEKIDWFMPDLILADYNLPDYTGLDALMHVKTKKPFVPFVFVTGGLRPDDPVAGVVLKLAEGYVLKDDLSIIPKTLQLVMEEMKDKIENQAAETQQKYDEKISILKNIKELSKSKDAQDKNKIQELLKELD